MIRDRDGGVISDRSDVFSGVFTEARACVREGTSLRRASFRGASQRAGLIWAGGDFREADFSGATLATLRSQATNFRDAIFNGADLTLFQSVLSDFRGASFRGADLTKANLSGCDLRDCDFSGAILLKTDLRGANMLGAIVDAKDMKHALTTDDPT